MVYGAEKWFSIAVADEILKDSSEGVLSIWTSVACFLGGLGWDQVWQLICPTYNCYVWFFSFGNFIWSELRTE